MTAPAQARPLRTVPGPRRHRPGHRWRRDESGVTTLVEVAVCVGLLSLLGAVIFPLVVSFAQESTSISATYNAVDQLIGPTQTLALYLHEAVEPAAVGTTNNGSEIWSTFSIATATEIQFTADVGAYGSTADAGNFTAYGPAQVTVQEKTGPDGKQELAGTLERAVQNTCPATGSTGSACQWTATGTLQLFTIPDLSTTSVFSFLISGGATTSAPTTAQMEAIEAVTYTVQTTNHTALPGGTQSEAALLAPSYNAGVG